MQYLFFQSLSFSENHKRFLLHTHGFMNYYWLYFIECFVKWVFSSSWKRNFFPASFGMFYKNRSIFKERRIVLCLWRNRFSRCVCVCGGEHFSSRKKFKECKLVSKHRLQELLMVSKSLAKSIKSSNIRSCLFRIFCY